MNREILFRGKPIDKKFGEWVEGFYMEDLNNGRMKSFIFNSPLQIEIDPETIGQFIRIYDNAVNQQLNLLIQCAIFKYPKNGGFEI